MTDELSGLNFEEDLKQASEVPEAYRWKIQKAGPLELYVDLSSEKSPQEFFQARLLWVTYPGESPPSLKFRDPTTGRIDLATAWPVVRGFRPASFDACVNWCAEGFALHPEWKNDPNVKWNPAGNPILRTLRNLQNEMDRHFQGRFRQ